MSNELDTIINTMRQQGRVIDQFAINEARAMLAHKGKQSALRCKRLETVLN